MSDDRGTPPGRKHPSRAEFDATVADIEARARATSDRINARTGRNLGLAIVVGVVLGGALLSSLLIIKELYMLFAVVLIPVTALELAGALRSAGRDVPRIPVAVASVVIVPLTFYAV